jgi:hypothetical protein
LPTEDIHLAPVVTEVADVFAVRGIPEGVRVADLIARADRMGLRQIILDLISCAPGTEEMRSRWKRSCAKVLCQCESSTTVPVCPMTSSPISSIARCMEAVVPS